MSILNRSYSRLGADRAAKLLALLLLLASCASAQVVLSRNCATGHVIGTTYQNGPTYPLIVIAVADSNGTWGTFSGDIGATSGLGTNVFAENPSNAGVSVWDTTFFFVPANYYYKVSSGINLDRWCEYQIKTGTLTMSANLGPSGSNTRALTTTYTNSGTDGLFAQAVITGITSNADCQGFVNGNMPRQVSNDSGGYSTQTVTLPVPAGQTYSITCPGGTIQSWYEYGIGAVFFDPGDQTSAFTINSATPTKNTGLQPWFISVPVINNNSTGSGHTFSLLSDASNPPTTAQMQQTLRRAFSPIAHSTVFGIVMPGEYALITDDAGASNVGSARLYSLNGIPFAAKTVLQFANP